MSEEDKFLKLDYDLLENSLKEVENKLDEIEDEMIQEVIDETVEFAYGVMGIAMRNAPKKTGNLRGSAVATTINKQVGHTEKDEASDVGAKAIRDLKTGAITLDQFIKEIAGEIIFNTEYATDQHENLSFHHTDGEAKFLENAILGQSEKFAKNIAEAVKKKGGGG